MEAHDRLRVAALGGRWPLAACQVAVVGWRRRIRGGKLRLATEFEEWGR